MQVYKLLSIPRLCRQHEDVSQRFHLCADVPTHGQYLNHLYIGGVINFKCKLSKIIGPDFTGDSEKVEAKTVLPSYIHECM